MNKVIKAGLFFIFLLFSSLGLAKEYKLFAYGEKGTPQYDFLLEKIKKFESMHEDVKIKLDSASNQAYHAKLKILSVANKLPDVMTIFPGNRSDYVTQKGLIADLTPLIDTTLKEKFIPQALLAQGGDGEVYALPQNLTLTGVVYANEALMKKLHLTYPKTYQEWLGQVKTIQKAGLTPVSIGNKSPWVMQSIVLSAILGRTAGDEWLDKAIHGQASFTDKPFLSALKIIEQMYKEGLLDKATPNWDYNQGTNEFLASKAVYSMNGGWIINNYIKTASPEFLENLTMHALPSIAGENQRNTISGTLGTGFGIASRLPKSDQKILFDLVKLQAGLGAEQSAIQAGIIPLLKGLAFPEDTNPLVKNLKKLTDETKMTYVFDGVMDSESVTHLQNLIQEIFLGTKTAEEAASDFEKYVSKNSSMRKEG